MSERTNLTDEEIRTDVTEEIRQETADADMDDSHDARSGPCQAVSGRGARLTSSKRAQVRVPSKSATTAHQPWLSRAAGSVVMSFSPKASRPPK